MRKLILILFVTLLFASLSGNAIQNANSARPLYAPDKIKVQLTSEAIKQTNLPEGMYAEAQSFGIAELDKIFRQFNGGRVIRAHRRVKDTAWEQETGFDRWFLVTVPMVTIIPNVIKAFQASKYIETACPEYFAYKALVPNDTYYPNNWGHNNTAQLPVYSGGSHSGAGVGTIGFDSNAQAAWNNTQGLGSASIVIGIIDTGVDTAHPDLRLVSGYDFGDNDSNPMDDSADPGHGTSCSGVAAGIGNNALGVCGIAAGCSVMPLKIASADGSLGFTAIENALTYAGDNGVDVASMSFGASMSVGSSPSTDAALAYAYSHGVVLLAATANANTSTIDYPSKYPNVIAVGASSPTGQRKSTTSSDGENWWGSNYGVNTQDSNDAVDICAPTILPATDISGTGGYDTGNYYMWFNGTSCATPYAAGIAGLILSKEPTLTPAQVWTAMKSTATDMTSDGGAGWDRYTGYGLVNAEGALNSLIPGMPTCTITSPASGSVFNLNTTVTVNVTATDSDGTINRVDFYLDGALTPTSTDSSVPYSWNWNTTGAASGSHTIVAKAVDNLSNVTESTISVSLIAAAEEGFETGNFTAFSWVQSGTQPWIVQATDKYSGTYAARSGTILANQTSTMTATMITTAAGNISFFQKTSSESGYDYLRFYIDGVQQAQWSGDVPWTQQTYAVSTAGSHTFAWTYSKDGSVDTGSDCGYVDHIIFPPHSTTSFYPPQNLAAVVSHAKVALTWAAPVSGTPSGYKVYRNSTLLTTVTTLYYNDTAVNNGTSYSYYVKATYTSPTAGDSDPTATVNATPVALPPTGLAAVTTHKVILTWVAPAAGTPTGYKVYRNSTQITTVTALTYTDTAVSMGTAYSYYVTATYASPTAESAATSTVNGTPVAAPPTTLAGTAGNNTVSLSWLAPVSNTPSGYKIYRNSAFLANAATLTYTDNAVTNGTSYTYYVTATYTGPTVESAASNTVSLTPNSATVVTIGTGTSVQRQPFGMYYDYERSAALYLSSDIGTTGVINSLSWYVGTAQTAAAPIVIYLKTTTATVMTSGTWASMISGATTVYPATSQSFTTTGWKTITLNTPFTYSGNNLLVMVETSIGAWTSSYPTFRYTSSTTGRHQYWYTDGTPPSGNGTLGYYLPNLQISLTALAPSFSLTPSSLPYGNISTGQTSTQSFTISNTGTAALTGNITTITGYSVSTTREAASGLSSQSSRENRNVLPYSVGAGLSQTFYLTFAPTAAIAYNGNITISSNDAAHATNYLAVTGAGVVASPIFGVNPASLPFGNVLIGMSAVSTFDITNTGNATLTGNITTTDGYSVNNARAVGNGFGSSVSTQTRNVLAYSVEAGLSQTFYLTFTPTVSQTYDSYVTITSNDTAHPSNLVILTGTGVTPVFNAPYDLAAIPGNTVINLSWSTPVSGDGVLTGFNVYRDNTLITPSPVATTLYSDTGLTNGVLYTYYVTAVYSTPTGESAASGSASATPVGLGDGVVQIGDGSVTGMSLPIEPWYGYTYSQSIMLQSDINVDNQQITKIAWYYSGTNTWTDALKIYLGHTTQTSFASVSSWIPYNQLTLVYDGLLNAPATPGWIEFTLATPFLYNNTDNLVIAVDENTAGYHADADEFYCTSVSGYRSLVFYSDSTNPDPVSPPTSGSFLYQRQAVPNTQLTFTDPPTEPVFYINPVSLDYGTVNINSVHEQSVRVSNNGTGTLTLETIGLTNPVYTIVNPPVLPLNLTAGQYVDFTILYSPVTPGSYSANLSITDNLSRTEHLIPITGSAVDPLVTTFPWTESFSSWPPLNWSLTGGTRNWASYAGTCAYANFWGWQVPNNSVMTSPPLLPSQPVKLQFNWSHLYDASYPNDALRVSYSTDQTNWTEIWYKAITDLNSNDGAANTAPGTFVTEEILLPTELVNQTFYLQFDGISGYGPDLFVDEVIVSPSVLAPVISITPLSLAFGTIEAGTTSQQTLAIQNTGSANLTGSLVTPTGYSAALFSLLSQRNSLDFDLAPGQTATYTITFAPLLAQTYAGDIVVTSNDSNSPVLNIPVTGGAYIPPTITVNPTTLNSYLAIGANETQDITLGNTGSQDLNYTIQVNGATVGNSAVLFTGSTGRDITGSVVTVNPTVYEANTTVNWTLSVTNNTPDGEWLKDVAITFPAGVTINSSTPFSGGSGGDLTSNAVTGNGVTVVWHGETPDGWGFIGDFETATAMVNVTIAAGISGDITIPYVISGDVYGSEPHVINGSFTLSSGVPPVTWLTASPLSGTIPAGETRIISAHIDTAGLNQGDYQAQLVITSNDPATPQSNVDIFLQAANGNHPPAINLPPSFSFDKNGSLLVSFYPYTSDADGDSLYLTMSGNTHIRANIARRRVILSADPYWFGSEVVTFTVTDGQASATTSVTVNVLPTAIPVWTPVEYPNPAATVNGVVTLDAVDLNIGDIVGAFAGNECRGVGTIFQQRSISYVNLPVNLAADGENITFKVYNAQNDQVIETQSSVVLHFGEEVGNPARFPIVLYSTPLPYMAVSNQALSLQWNAIPNVTGYKIYRADTPEGPYTLYATTTNNWYDLPLTETRGFFKVSSENTARSGRGRE